MARHTSPVPCCSAASARGPKYAWSTADSTTCCCSSRPANWRRWARTWGCAARSGGGGHVSSGQGHCSGPLQPKPGPPQPRQQGRSRVHAPGHTLHAAAAPRWRGGAPACAACAAPTQSAPTCGTAPPPCPARTCGTNALRACSKLHARMQTRGHVDTQYGLKLPARAREPRQLPHWGLPWHSPSTCAPPAHPPRAPQVLVLGARHEAVAAVAQLVQQRAQLAQA